MYLKLDDVAQLEFVNEHPRDLALHLEDEEGAFSIECLILKLLNKESVPYLNMVALSLLTV